MKSHVSIAQGICPICGTTHDTGEILLDKHLRDSMEMHTITGWHICPECKSKTDQGYIRLVEIDPAKSTVRPNGNIDPEGAFRTGLIMDVRKEVFQKIFNVPATQSFVFIDPEVTSALMKMMPKEGE